MPLSIDQVGGYFQKTADPPCCARLQDCRPVTRQGVYSWTLLDITRQIEAEAEAARHFRRFCRRLWEA